jgi:stearoyl-CoA desaturase (delta-9 desaturase)
MNELIYTLVLTHITIACVTLYLHRSQAHRSVTFHPVIAHAMRFWLWLTTGMVTKQWVAIHRKHHQHDDQPGDPHSPHVFGIWRVLLGGAFLYARAAKDRAMIENYGVGTPNDWIEHKVYTPLNWVGILIMLALNICIFGAWGLLIWGVQMIWIPFWAAGVVNGLGHWWGYRNGQTRDQSRNLVPISIIIGGEELHNNHHLDPASPRLSRRWFEFDIGWMYIRILQTLGLAKLRVANQ